MTGLATAAPKLAKLIPLLASDKDGEVIATARAIGRTLAAAGADFHALAAAISGPGEAPQRTAAEWGALIRAVLADPPQLHPGEQKFLRDMDRRTGRGQMPSPKQAAWLSKIAGRAA